MIGIYAITHVASGRCYVGSSSNIRRRWNVHRRELKLGTHSNRYLQHASIKYGVDSFEFSILVEMETVDGIYVEEQRWINQLKPAFNLAPVAGSARGVKLTLEMRAKISESNRRRGPRSVETRLKISVSKKGIRSRLGAVLSEETKQKIGNANRGKPGPLLGVAMSNETKEKLRASRLGTTWSAARRLAHEAKWANREKASPKKVIRPRKPREEWRSPGRPRTAEQRAALSARMRGKPKSPEHLAKIAEATRRRWADPGQRAKILASKLKGTA